jgi:putative transposase
MARKLRIEFPGAIYHVINRGNYRTDVFRSAGEAKSFLAAVEEAVARWGLARPGSQTTWLSVGVATYL